MLVAICSPCPRREYGNLENHLSWILHFSQASNEKSERQSSPTKHVQDYFRGEIMQKWKQTLELNIQYPIPFPSWEGLQLYTEPLVRCQFILCKTLTPPLVSHQQGPWAQNPKNLFYKTHSIPLHCTLLYTSLCWNEPMIDTKII